MPTAASNTGAFDVVTATDSPAAVAARLVAAPVQATVAAAPVTRAPINLVAATPLAVGRFTDFLTGAGG